MGLGWRTPSGAGLPAGVEGAEWRGSSCRASGLRSGAGPHVKASTRKWKLGKPGSVLMGKQSLFTGGAWLLEERGQRQLCMLVGEEPMVPCPLRGLRRGPGSVVGSWGSSRCWSSSSRAARGPVPQTEREVGGISSLKAELFHYSFWRVFAFLDEAEAGILIFPNCLLLPDGK